MLLLEPKARRGVVVMTNCEWANPAQVAAAVLDAVAEKSTPAAGFAATGGRCPPYDESPMRRSG